VSHIKSKNAYPIFEMKQSNVIVTILIKIPRGVVLVLWAYVTPYKNSESRLRGKNYALMKVSVVCSMVTGWSRSGYSMRKPRRPSTFYTPFIGSFVVVV